MDDRSDILARACKAVEKQRLGQASTILATEYPFTPPTNAGRKYSPSLLLGDAPITRQMSNYLAQN